MNRLIIKYMTHPLHIEQLIVHYPFFTLNICKKLHNKNSIKKLLQYPVWQFKDYFFIHTMLLI